MKNKGILFSKTSLRPSKIQFCPKPFQTIKKKSAMVKKGQGGEINIAHANVLVLADSQLIKNYTF